MTKTAWLNLRYTVPERREAFTKGLQRLGYNIREGSNAIPKTGDIFVTWNRIGAADNTARDFQAQGLPVIVAENASWGNDFAGKQWYTLARNYHNTAYQYPIGDLWRWDNLGIELMPFKKNNSSVIILPQRGIGSPPTVMPQQWATKAQSKYGGTIRNHPGRNKNIVTLEQELQNYGTAITWGSGAAIKALMMGLKVKSEMPNWIGEQDNTEQGRLAMFRKLAWANWELNEIKDGTAFAWLLS
jgi:hypothetical protein